MNLQLIFAAISLISIGSVYYFFHSKPIADFKAENEKLVLRIVQKDSDISDLESQLAMCIENSRQSSFNSFVNGLMEGNNESNFTDYPKFSF